MDDVADPSLDTVPAAAPDLFAGPSRRRPRRGSARTGPGGRSTVGDGSGAVTLRLDPSASSDAAGLRQQLALCLAVGITRIEIDVRELDGLDDSALQALHGVHDYLSRRSGSLTLVGAGDRVLAALTSRHLESLLPADQAAARTVRPATSSAPAPGGTTRHSRRPSAAPPQEALPAAGSTSTTG